MKASVRFTGESTPSHTHTQREREGGRSREWSREVEREVERVVERGRGRERGRCGGWRMTWMRGVFFVPSRPALVFDRSSKRACAHCFKFVGVADISGAFVWLLFLFSLLFLLSFLSSFLSSFLFFLSFFLSFFFFLFWGRGGETTDLLRRSC